MTDREAVQILKASRKGFKAALTRARNVAESAFQDYVEGDDPGLLEEFLGHWDNRLQKFLSAEDQVNCHLASDIKDSDPAVDEHVQAFFKAKSKVVGFRRDVEAVIIRTEPIRPVRESGPSRQSLPKIDAKKPPILQEDTDHKMFTGWRPLWNNYAKLIYLNERDQDIQVGLFWECCSSGFLRTINHSLGIKSDTSRSVDEILNLIEEFLRSLRNIHLDLRDLLSVRQKEGQDYSSFCNTIRELADYADTANITENRLLIALLLQGMRSDSDKAKTMERNPKSFEEARKFILKLETSRRGAREFSSVAFSHSVNAVDQTVNGTKSNYKKKGGKSAFKKGGSSEKCPFYGNPKWHAREECPASRSSCHGCGRNGHWLLACRSKSQNQLLTIPISNLCADPLWEIPWLLP
ncbi:uncharacterized protein LOC131876991 [Tigriopus californicus]|uniref:uncharacterized protein LOC131876991 n=1 Tax=Tigriopus californicus TaxID=6832 RepID=UPI0027DA9604|nr:uncharacterized protein LOC131876991 [Tigriopus californicus]